MASLQVGGSSIDQGVKKNKKKPSFLKKRILKERYRIYQEQQATKQEIEQKTLKEEPNASRHGLVVFGLSEGIDLSDSDELEELLSNIKELFSPFSDLVMITLFQQTDHIFPPPFTSCIVLEYSEEQSAKDASSFMHGRMIGGEEILIFLLPSLQHQITVGDNSVPQESQAPAISSQQYVVPTALLSLENVFSVEDIMEGDLDSLEETCRDILSLCEPFPGAVNISYSTNTHILSFSQSMTVEHFRQLLVSQWQSKFHTSAIDKDKNRAKLTTSQKNHLKSIKKFHKPLLCITFQGTTFPNPLNNSNVTWSVWQASPWIAICTASITHGLFIGGEEVCVHCLLTSLSKEPFLMGILSSSNMSSTEAANIEPTNVSFYSWEMQVFVSSQYVEAIQLFCTEHFPIISFVSSEKKEDTISIFKLRTDSVNNMIQIWQKMIQSKHLLQEMFIFCHQQNGEFFCFFHASIDPTRDNVPYQACSITLYLENFITTEDMHEYLVSNASHEELAIAKQDLLQIWQNQITVLFDTKLDGNDFFNYIVSFISQLTVLPFHLAENITNDHNTDGKLVEEDESLQESTMENLNENTKNDNETVTVEVMYSDRLHAVQAMCYFDGLILGGEPISARLTSVTAVHSANDSNITAINDENNKLNSNDGNHTTVHPPTEPSVCALLQEWVSTHALSMMKNHNSSQLTQVYREDLSTFSQLISEKNSSNIVNKTAEKEDQETDDLALFTSQASNTFHNPATLKARKISLYRIAKHAPHLSSHNHNNSKHKNSNSDNSDINNPFSLLTIPIATEEINTYTKEFLRLLSDYQRFLRDKLLSERPPFPVYPDNSPKLATIKAKQLQAQALAAFKEGQLRKFKLKLRYVCGLKQSLQALKSGRVKLIFLAPNTESAMALDHKVAQVVQVAEALEVPVLYALSRRLLGKALQMTIKQSCIAVLSAEGRQDCYELYRKIMTFAKSSK